MGNYKIFLGILASALALVSYCIYFFEILKNKVKPHAFSWLVWGLTTGIIFVAQVVKHAGPGSWMTGLTCLACVIIFCLSLAKGYKSFVFLDWVFLIAALISLLLWKITNDPTLSVVLITATDALGALPSLRKAYEKPYDESLILFSLGSFKALIALFALQSYALAAYLYPAMLVVVNPAVVFTIVIRRNKVAAKEITNG